MKLTGDIKRIKNKRDDRNQDIEIEVDKIEYLTSKKDGRYFQAFDFEETLETPLVITGDCLALKPGKPAEEDEYEFNVYDKEGEEYVLNPDKFLSLSIAYDFDEDLTILTSVYYSVTLPPKDFEELKKEKEKERSFKNRKSGRK
ncbi:hypothetical protein [Adhaeribacter soli]|uniref:Uncharacterized protein n=1 Tax=Adhaeribacter soli TaxID=2607655 RepID=A0A5N1J4G3_9BACT|nr:hypothetical protein [Adhaeribacter soli]KAA9345597.1 hypothetical protein F0P94_00470 [Adhaeribacter soli]